MTWKNVQEIRMLEPYCKKFKYRYIVAFSVDESGKKYVVTTYGKNKQYCKVAALAGYQLKEIVLAGDWPQWTELEPLYENCDPKLFKEALRVLEFYSNEYEYGERGGGECHFDAGKKARDFLAVVKK